MRCDGRKPEKLRPVKVTKNYTKYAEGSCLIEMGNTKVICTASVEENVPPFLKNTGTGWVTAEYGMLPRSTHTRNLNVTLTSAGFTKSEMDNLIDLASRGIKELVAMQKKEIKI